MVACVAGRVALCRRMAERGGARKTAVRRNLRDFNASVARYVPSTYVPESKQGEQAELRCRPPRVRAPRGARSP